MPSPIGNPSERIPPDKVERLGFPEKPKPAEQTRSPEPTTGTEKEKAARARLQYLQTKESAVPTEKKTAESKTKTPPNKVVAEAQRIFGEFVSMLKQILPTTREKQELT